MHVEGQLFMGGLPVSMDGVSDESGENSINLSTYWMERPGYETISLSFNTRPPALRDLA